MVIERPATGFWLEVPVATARWGLAGRRAGRDILSVWDLLSSFCGFAAGSGDRKREDATAPMQAVRTTEASPLARPLRHRLADEAIVRPALSRRARRRLQGPRDEVKTRVLRRQPLRAWPRCTRAEEGTRVSSRALSLHAWSGSPGDPVRLLLLCLLFRSSWLAVRAAAGGSAPSECCIAAAGSVWLVALRSRSVVDDASDFRNPGPVQQSRVGLQAAGARPFHKPGAGSATCPCCWRSRRIAISSSSDRANATRIHMQLHADDGRARDPGGSPFTCESGARPRERRAVGARPQQQRPRVRVAPLHRWNSALWSMTARSTR